MLQAYFTACEERFPQRKSELRRVSLALRRERIHSMEGLIRLWESGPERLLAIRSIGTKSLELIDLVCRQYVSEQREGQTAP